MSDECQNVALPFAVFMYSYIIFSTTLHIRVDYLFIMPKI